MKQNVVEANRVKMDEMQGQQDYFDMKMAQAETAASVKRTSFDSQMARSALEAVDMKAAYDKLTSENADQMKTAAQVRTLDKSRRIDG